MICRYITVIDTIHEVYNRTGQSWLLSRCSYSTRNTNTTTILTRDHRPGLPVRRAASAVPIYGYDIYTAKGYCSINQSSFVCILLHFIFCLQKIADVLRNDKVWFEKSRIVFYYCLTKNRINQFFNSKNKQFYIWILFLVHIIQLFRIKINILFLYD